MCNLLKISIDIAFAEQRTKETFTLSANRRAETSAAGPDYVQLIITPRSTNSEPSTLLLFATGMIDFVSAIRRRVAEV